MKQLAFTDEQKFLLKRIDLLFEEARSKDISFVYDKSDGTLSAFNSANVSDFYASSEYRKEEEDDEEIDFEKCFVFEGTCFDYIDYATQNYYLKFK